MIKLLVADDSAFMRLALEKILSRDPDFEIIGFCKDGEEVLEKLKYLKPDVLTLDIEMPKINGLKVLEKIMTESPLPVVMVSSLTHENAEETIKAFELGAVDVVAKPASFISLKITDIYDELAQKIKIASKAKVIKQIKTPKLKFLSEKKSYQIQNNYKNFSPEIIIIGISTGGPAGLHKILPLLPENLPCPIIVAQHMPEGFTKSLANRLNYYSKIKVKEAENGEKLSDSIVYIAPSGYQTELRKKYLGKSFFIRRSQEKELFKPSIDVTFNSAAEIFGDKVLGIIMTGMGKDGTEGAKKIKKKKGLVFVESKESCVISSMPDSAIKSGVVDSIYKLDEFPQVIKNLFKKNGQFKSN